MLIPVLTEPNFRSYLWAKQTLAGISQEAARRKYKLFSLDAESYETFDYDALFGAERRMVIVIGTSVTWMPKALDFFSRRNIDSVFISFDPSETTLPAGMVRMDYVYAIHHLICYLKACGRKQIALYGYNKNSSADNIKMRFFRNQCRRDGVDPETRIFYNNGSLPDCYAVFRKEIPRFDAVICANDIAAVSLLSFLKQDQVSVPEQLFLTAFGDSIIAERVDPPLTIATLDHHEMGRQAVIQFASLNRQPPTASISVRVRSHLIIRESTARMPDRTGTLPPVSEDDAFTGNIDFYSDPEAERLLRAETLLSACDKTDLQFLGGLLAGLSMEAMEKKLFLTTSALQYRKRRLMNTAECAHTSDFLDFLRFCRSKGIL